MATASDFAGMSPMKGMQLMKHRSAREKNHPVRLYLERVASQDVIEFPEWDLTKALPKLPIPPLRGTLCKYLDSIRSTTSEAEYQRTVQIVEEFGSLGGVGEMLQKRLMKFAENEDNWVYQFWFDDMYMKVRLSLPINSNPGMVFPRPVFEDRSSQIRYAARFISGILDYKVVIDSRLLPLDRARSREKGQPLCMEQYYRLFTSYRYPGLNKDSLVTSEPAENNFHRSEHCIVAYKGQFFALDLVSAGIRLSDDSIYAQLKRCVKMAEEEIDGSFRCNRVAPPSVGILTAASRNVWATVRKTLCEDATNRSNLEEIETCMFVICLDAPVAPLDPEEQRESSRSDISLAMQMIHGAGSKNNSCNRWFEKTMQFVIGEDGACGLCYEHSAAEGIVVVQLVEHLLKYMDELQRRKLVRLQSMCDLAMPRYLPWKVNAEVKHHMLMAATNIDRSISNLDLNVLRYTTYGKNFPKSQNMSPDAFIQIALQLAYYRMHGRLVSTYESASIRRFLHGRVDNIRACSPEALSWCQAMMAEGDVSDEEKIDLLRKAIKKQTTILVETILGQGTDNHLLGLKQIAEESSFPLPQIFTDPSYIHSNQFTLSTSQVPTTMDAFMCYGPVVEDGYGACYNPHPDYILVCLSSFKKEESTNSTAFARSLEKTFDQMKQICESTSKKKKTSAPPKPPQPLFRGCSKG